MPSPSDPRRERIARALERIKAWMRAHGAAVLVNNLAAGISGPRLEELEDDLGVPLPADLRALWSIHGGQRDEQNGFVGAMDLLGPQAAADEQAGLMLSIESLREAPDSWRDAGVTHDEAQSDAWLAIAGRGYADLLVVSGRSGRVFTCEKDVPPLHLVADSITDWLEAYASRVEAGAYAVEPGFGDCYLSRPDAMY